MDVVRAALFSLPAVIAVGCSCSDQNFTPNSFAPLENDHGRWLSMGVAPDGRLVVSFYDKTKTALGFAIGTVKNSSEILWQYEQIDGYPDIATGLDPGDVGLYTSLVVADDGSVWVAYQDVTAGSLKVAKRTGRTWEVEVADTTTSFTAKKAGMFTSIAIDAEGNPVVAHHDGGTGELRIARRTGGSWQAETAWTGEDYTGLDADGNEVTRPASVGQFAQLEIVGNTEYVTFYDAAQQTLNLLEGFPGSYSHTIVDDSGNVGQWPSVLVEDDGLSIAYQDAGNHDLKLATRSGSGGFELSILDDGEYVGADTAIFRHDGAIGVVYFDGRANNMNLALEEADGWSWSTLGGEEAAVGFHNEVAQDLSGRWWAASYDFTNRTIFSRRLFGDEAAEE